MLPEELSLVTAELIKFLIATGGQCPMQLLKFDRTMYLEGHFLMRDRKGKSGRRMIHVVPLTPLSQGCLDWLDSITKDDPYPFLASMKVIA